MVSIWQPINTFHYRAQWPLGCLKRIRIPFAKACVRQVKPALHFFRWMFFYYYLHAFAKIRFYIKFCFYGFVSKTRTSGTLLNQSGHVLLAA